jgi:hypothetical protein
MKYFISGAISRYATTPEGRKEVTDKFMGAEFDLITKQIATEVFNPIRLVDEFGWEEDWKVYMSACLMAIVNCDAIYMLRGWQLSKGAKLEHTIAEELGIKIVYEE